MAATHLEPSFKTDLSMNSAGTIRFGGAGFCFAGRTAIESADPDDDSVALRELADRFLTATAQSVDPRLVMGNERLLRWGQSER